MEKLKQVLRNKDKKLTQMIAKFGAEFDTFSIDLQKRLKKLFSQGVFDKETVNAAFADAGYDDLVNAWIDNYSEVITFNKQLSSELGTKFILTPRAIRNYELLQDMDFDKLKINQEAYATDMRRMALKHSLEGKSFRDAAFNTELTSATTAFKRRVEAEAYTGISSAESTIKLDWFKEAGIDKYVYMGPQDSKTRDECLNTLTDSRQGEGWTLAEVNASETPFISKGGWNCRHDWLPFVEDMPA